jgi:hypothetical protein
VDNKQMRRELKKIGDRNRRFNKMSPEKKRVTIAKDTIAALKTNKVCATVRVYLGESARSNGDKLSNNVRCQACALGSMFVGLTTRIKDLSVKVDSYRQQVVSPLAEYFSPIQLKVIESAFEGGMHYSDIYNLYGDNYYDKAINYKYSYTDSEERLIAIMENIIKNNGEFIP